MHRRVLKAAVTAAGLLAVSASPAAARTLQAEDVLPPGQSGFVSITGLASGTGSPHLQDQTSLFTSFEYKPHTFNRPGVAQMPRPGVRIVRDAYGVPAITGSTDYNAWWGAGYAVAQDRLFQLELFRRATRGRLAEILGSGYLDDDYIARRDYYTDAEIQAMMAEVPALRARTIAYRDGVNAWIDHVQSLAGATDMPGEFPALLDLPIPHWTVADTGRVGVFLARTIPSDPGLELLNAEALQAIGGRNFKTLLPLRTPGRRSIVPPSEGSFPSQPGRTRREERIAFRKSRRFLNRIDFGHIQDTTEQLPLSGPGAPGAGLRSIIPSPGGSFVWAIRDPARRRAYLFNGPQLGYSIPQLLVEIEVHSPDLDARGVTAAGVPLVAIGRNAHVAWGYTSGESDDDDLYAEKLIAPESYRFRGVERQMDCRDETFTWNTPPTDLPDALQALIGAGGGAPAGSTTERICRTIHGPVQALGDDYAFARRYNTWKTELRTFVGLAELTEARTITDVNRAMRHVTWNENVTAADDRGHVGYWHPGRLPRRPQRWDERLPYPGTGKAEWRGFLRFRQRPHAIDPAQGWLANWNNVPSAGWTNGDGQARGRLTGTFHRVHLLQRLVAKVAANPGYGRSRSIVRTSGTTAQAFPFVSRRKLRGAKRRADPAGRRTLRALLAWDGDYHTTDGAGTVDPGVAIWEEFKDRLEARLLRPMGPEARLLSPEPSVNHAFDTANGEATALRLLGARKYARAAEATAAALTTRFGTADAAAWREPRRVYEVGAQGAATPPDLFFFDRGSWEQSVAVGR